MADSEQVSSTSPLGEELDKLHDHEMGDSNEAVAKEVVNEDEIVDLVGGAQDAIERHKATISYAEDIPQKLTEMSSTPDHEPMLLTESVPVVSEPMLVPNIAPPTVVEDATEQLTKEEAIPDSTVAEKEQKEEVADIVPLAEPVHTEPVPEPVFIQEPAPQPEITPEPAPEPEIIPEPIPEPVPEPAPEPVIASVEPPKAVPEEVLLPKAAPEKKAAAAPPPASLVEFLYWRDVKATGVVFGASLLLLLSLTVCSIVSVCSYVGLALLSVTISFRIYKGILQAIQKSDEGHPFKLYLDQEVALSEDAVHRYSDVALARINKTVGDLRRLFLVEDLIDSIKFAVLMWILTYVGALFNGLTLLILGLVGAFSCPIIYEKHQVQIDHYLGMVNNQIKDVVAKIQAKVPGLKRKAE
ncbi:reticulon-4b isoform X3 [Hypomesus transpacificus]|uniref:reticulon-4b isoform X3 n=1 Tax=Hypomesus transpacificus TaxID=137520 RepID=UPI001F0748DE|nr:reticulon-4b isoform X3 [Hypomesus transpacificus]